MAPVDHIEHYGDGKKYKVVFSEPLKAIGPIPPGNLPGAMQVSCTPKMSQVDEIESRPEKGCDEEAIYGRTNCGHPA